MPDLSNNTIANQLQELRDDDTRTLTSRAAELMALAHIAKQLSLDAQYESMQLDKKDPLSPYW